MFSLPSHGEPRGRIVVFVPRWRSQRGLSQGLPVQVVPTINALLRNRIAVDMVSEDHCGLDSDSVRRRLDSATAAVVWSNAFDLEPQLQSIRRFLGMARSYRPELRRLLGGGYWATAPAGFDLEGLGELVPGTDPWALAAHLGAADDRAFTADALDVLDLGRFQAPSPLRFGNDEPALSLPTGTGCSHTCNQCTPGDGSEHLLPAATVAGVMMRNYHSHGVRQFALAERDFLAHPERAMELATTLTRRGLPLRWTVHASVTDVLAMTTPQLAQLATAGLVGVELGIEAGSDSALAKLGKGYRVVHAVRAHDLLVAAGIDPIHDMLFGWPGETPRDRRATLDLIDRLDRTGRSGTFRFRRYRAMPTTVLGDAALRFGGSRPTALSALEAIENSGRTMPWVSAAEERRVRLLTDYILPMAYRSRPELSSARQWRALSTLARLRCRTGWMALPVDRAIFAASGDPFPTAV